MGKKKEYEVSEAESQQAGVVNNITVRTASFTPQDYDGKVFANGFVLLQSVKRFLSLCFTAIINPKIAEKQSPIEESISRSAQSDLNEINDKPEQQQERQSQTELVDKSDTKGWCNDKMFPFGELCYTQTN